jgi:hypothetical protein
MSIILMVLIVPLFGQNNLSITISKYPETLEFSKARDFDKGAKTKMKLRVSSDYNNNITGDWELSVVVDDDLQNGNQTIPISAISVNAKNNSQVRGLGDIHLSKQYQTIAKRKPNSKDKKKFDVNIDINAEDGSAFFNRSGDFYANIYFTLTID